MVEVGDHHLMDLVAKLVLSQLANGSDHGLSECVIDLFLVVVDCYLCVLQVLDVVQHVQRVPQCHQEVIHLVETLTVRNDLIE